MNNNNGVQKAVSAATNELWWWILRMEYLTEIDLIPTDPILIASIPSSFRRHQREALIDLQHRVLNPGFSMADAAQYIQTLIDEPAKLEQMIFP